ncbi:MAG: hypothetical protein KVP17_005130 [Porospora cf. gigantea B]|uniref:uncharacterized protein n=1 Tax=Porospora cf. gigantea B TaxID=2853592 RepID=UPI003571E93F|nr:MAG: hypothetical protein KVP17_005130 [Porospora cf. gigantea B]
MRLLVWKLAEFGAALECVWNCIRSDHPVDWTSVGDLVGKSPDEAEFVIMRAQPSHFRNSLGLLVLRDDAEMPSEVAAATFQTSLLQKHIETLRSLLS